MTSYNRAYLSDRQEIYPRQVQLQTKEYSDRAACLLACQNKWPENSQLGFTLALRYRVLVKLNFFQSGKEIKGGTRPFVVSKERGRDEVVIWTYPPPLETQCAIYPEHLDTGKLLIERAPQHIILGGHHGRDKSDTEFLHGGKLRRERVAQSCCRLWGPYRNTTRFGMRIAVAGHVFRLGLQRKVKNTSMEDYVHSVKAFLRLIDKPGKVYRGRRNVTELHANLLEIWG